MYLFFVCFSTLACITFCRSLLFHFFLSHFFPLVVLFIFTLYTSFFHSLFLLSPSFFPSCSTSLFPLLSFFFRSRLSIHLLPSLFLSSLFLFSPYPLFLSHLFSFPLHSFHSILSFSISLLHTQHHFPPCPPFLLFLFIFHSLTLFPLSVSSSRFFPSTLFFFLLPYPFFFLSPHPIFSPFFPFIYLFAPCHLPNLFFFFFF